MKGDQPVTIRLQDYSPPEYAVDQVDLRFELGEDETRVYSKMTVCRLVAGDPALHLDGRHLHLQSLKLDGRLLSVGEYKLDEEQLVLPSPPEQFTLEIETRIKPHENTSLEGLYKSSGNFCTQCEAQGFRTITFFPDRPDVMSRYTTTIVADKKRYPVLLSNGNPADEGELADGRHWRTWVDPFPKPSYLFALVAGDLRCMEDRYVTGSGRAIVLRIYVEPDDIDKCEHAMTSLKKAMRWDEDVFGLEYDLDIYMIVAVSDFNMGAMENKGLNIFNSKYVLARPETATDDDYDGILGVIGHEYFHNWTGNRVTCRDWFQLSLKEGLTVYRDQEFSADMTSRAVKRIQDVRALRARQFPEDDGPMAHPIRPDTYVEINNFYTATVYEKGAEVVRMYRTLLGVEGFRHGMDRYFQRHDGQAVTTEDFYAAMVDANDIDLGAFKRWYTQAGTPELTVEAAHDAASQVYSLSVRQHCPPTPGQTKKKQPLVIPLALALLDADGRELPLRLVGEPDEASSTERVLRVEQTEQEFQFADIVQPPVPSLLRGFSAPVRLRYPYSDDELAFLMAHDSDLYNRWEAGQQFAHRTALNLVLELQAGRELSLQPELIDGYRRMLTAAIGDKALVAEALVLPSEDFIAGGLDAIDPDAVHTVREFMRTALAEALHDEFLAGYRDNCSTQPYSNDPVSGARRQLKNMCLSYLMQLDDPHARGLCVQQYCSADNMTDTISALNALANCNCPERGELLGTFYEKWKRDALVVDKWLAIQARSKLPDTLEQVKRLMRHPAFALRNPNKVRALIGAFSHGNPVRFHAADGSGYDLLEQVVVALDGINPMVAARLLGAFSRWRKYEPVRRAHMRNALTRVLERSDVSKDCYEIATKSLADAP